MKLHHCFLATALLLTGCATQYVPPAGSATTTVVLVAPAEEMLGLGQTFSVCRVKTVPTAASWRASILVERTHHQSLDSREKSAVHQGRPEQHARLSADVNLRQSGEFRARSSCEASRRCFLTREVETSVQRRRYRREVDASCSDAANWPVRGFAAASSGMSIRRPTRAAPTG
jgi:hypothetical protein